MNYVKIGNEQRSLADASEQWINEQVRRRKQAGASTCVQVFLKTGPLDIVLSTSDCPSAAGGTRTANARELEVFDLWKKRGLDGQGFTIGNLIAFLHQIQRST
jgi:hypothetical protein